MTKVWARQGKLDENEHKARQGKNMVRWFKNGI